MNIRIFIVVIGFFFSLSELATSQSEYKPVFIKNILLSRFNIVGETNINRFNIEYNRIEPNHLSNNAWAGNNNEHIELNIPVERFECSNHLMKSDFLHMVKADLYPYISVKLNMDKTRLLFNQGVADLSNIIISFAGRSNLYHLVGEIQKIGENRYAIAGGKMVQFSDFNMVPPEKFLGLVRVKNEVFISFDLQLEIAEMKQILQ